MGRSEADGRPEGRPRLGRWLAMVSRGCAWKVVGRFRPVAADRQATTWPEARPDPGQCSTFAVHVVGVDALTIATMPALTAGGSPGHASTRACKSGSTAPTGQGFGGTGRQPFRRIPVFPGESMLHTAPARSSVQKTATIPRLVAHAVRSDQGGVDEVARRHDRQPTDPAAGRGPTPRLNVTRPKSNSARPIPASSTPRQSPNRAASQKRRSGRRVAAAGIGRQCLTGYEGDG